VEEPDPLFEDYSQAQVVRDAAQKNVEEPEQLFEDYNQAQAIDGVVQENADQTDPFVFLEDFPPTQTTRPTTPLPLTEDVYLDMEDALPPLPAGYYPYPETSAPVEGAPPVLPENDVIWPGQSTSLAAALQEEASQEPDIAQVHRELAEAIRQRPEAYLDDKDMQDTAREAIRQLETRGMRWY